MKKIKYFLFWTLTIGLLFQACSDHENVNNYSEVNDAELDALIKERHSKLKLTGPLSDYPEIEKFIQEKRRNGSKRSSPYDIIIKVETHPFPNACDGFNPSGSLQLARCKSRPFGLPPRVGFDEVDSGDVLCDLDGRDWLIQLNDEDPSTYKWSYGPSGPAGVWQLNRHKVSGMGSNGYVIDVFLFKIQNGNLYTLDLDSYIRTAGSFFEFSTFTYSSNPPVNFDENAIITYNGAQHYNSCAL